MEKQRRTALKRLFGAIGGVLGVSVISKAETVRPEATGVRHEAGSAEAPADQVPLFSQYTIHNGLVYIAGQGAHVAPFEIKAHTEIVLKGLEKQLTAAGSSMEKVLKVTVFLNDIADYKGMNEVFQGRFGSKPPVRTTIAVAKGGVPGDSLVEMDCIAYI